MAFPVPSHLPRKKDQDVSTLLLSKMSETTFKTLTHEAASSWIADLNVAIQQTKGRIHDRIHSDLPAFEVQLSTSKSVQERLQSLSSNVRSLETACNDPETGLVPNLVTSLTRHAALAQEAADADVKRVALAHLNRCRQELRDLVQLVKEGRLPDAMAACARFETLLSQSPRPLQETPLLVDLKRVFRATNDRTDELLNDAYSRSVIVNASEIVIRPSVQARDSDTILRLADVVSSLTPTSLNNVISTLRRDLTTHYIHRLLKQPVTVSVSSTSALTGVSEQKLTVVLDPPHSGSLTSRITSLSSVLTFLNEHLFPRLPAAVGFPVSLCKPLSSALLSELLIPSLPTNAADLPSFLKVVQQAVDFERVYLGHMLGDKSTERDIKLWADALPAHYERKRRVGILEETRALILAPEDANSSFHATVVPPASAAALSPETSPREPDEERASSPEETAWGFENGNDEDAGAVDEDGWGFDDEGEGALAPASAPAAPAPAAVEPAEEEPEEEQVEDAWGWNEDEQTANADEDNSTDSSAWDDPWGENVDAAPSSQPKAKAATKLEKLSAKGKKKEHVPPAPPVTESQRRVVPSVAAKSAPTPSASKSAPTKPEPETYLVSGRVKSLLALAENVLNEASDLVSSGVLRSHASSTSSPIGTILHQTAGLMLELYRGLYPVAAAAKLADSPKAAMGFSNNCRWLGEQVQRVAARRDVPAPTAEKLREGAEVFKVLAESWFDDTLYAQERKVNATLDRAEGFVNTTNQDRYDECEAAVSQALRDIRQMAQQCKPILPKSKYYQAVGTVVNAALARLLADMLAIPDIIKDESHNLSELCHILNASEGLFVEDPAQPSFVVAYVPLWLKFSYLSELMEASIADISYLFEEGALVDFEIEELVNLVKALFADTPLRANTINKLMQGHPQMS